MTKKLPAAVTALLLLLCSARGQNYLLYHERSTAGTGCGNAPYLSQLQPPPTDSVRISFLLHSQLNAIQTAVYYTTDGSNPSGTLGIPTGATQVAWGNAVCTSSSFTTFTASIPPLPPGTIVTYIFSAWNSSGYEVFGNSQFCPGCTPVLTSTGAARFRYAVQGVLPINFINFTGREGNSLIRIFWASAQESNMDRYEVYRSRNSLQFEKAGTIPAVGNTSQRTDYFFDDLQPARGNNYYKVTAFDKAGKSVSTSIIRILFGINDNSLVVFSNPAAGIINLRVVDVIRDEYAIRVFDNGGRLVYNGKVLHNGADAIYPVKLPQPLARGNYRVVITNRYQFYQSSFLVE